MELLCGREMVLRAGKGVLFIYIFISSLCVFTEGGRHLVRGGFSRVSEVGMPE